MVEPYACLSPHRFFSCFDLSFHLAWQSSNWRCENVADSGIKGVYCGGSPGFQVLFIESPLSSPCWPRSKGGKPPQ